MGKWHLGDGNHCPETHGFAENIGGTHWGAPTTFWWPYAGAGRFGAEHRYGPHLEFGRAGEGFDLTLRQDAQRDLRVHQQATTANWFFRGGRPERTSEPAGPILLLDVLIGVGDVGHRHRLRIVFDAAA